LDSLITVYWRKLFHCIVSNAGYKKY
jgi:hypothetical protein